VAAFTLLTDFDGVWTDPRRELQAVLDFLAADLARLAGWPAERVEAACARFRAGVLAAPERHGWLVAGRFSSYVDEDVFALPTALGQWIDAAPDAEAAELREAVLREHAGVGSFLDRCYHSTCARFRAEVPHDLAPGAERVLEWLLRHEVRVVFASNAPLEKVQGWFACHGLEVADARATEPGAAPLRAYGRSGKQWLSPRPELLHLGGRPVAADRPQYRAILEREQADLVVGDVPSLDLAAPLALRAEGGLGAPRALALMNLPHTPAWARAAAGGGPGAVDALVSHVTALPRLVHALRGSLPAAAGSPRSG
jgi:phosphoglycolate phosphatase-like HAD superfamily hydrolase